jgi:hypothetical protein
MNYKINVYNTIGNFKFVIRNKDNRGIIRKII